MKPLIAYEIRLLAKDVTDNALIAKFINRSPDTKITARDVAKLLDPPLRAPVQIRSTKLMAEPIAWQPPISTNRGGFDPLAVATNRYLEKHRDRIVATELARLEAGA